MRIELIRLHEQIGKTFIYVTHDQTEAMTMGDNLVVMQKGNVEQVGSPHEIYKNPVNDYVATFIGETNEISGTICELSPEPILETPSGMKIKVDIRDNYLKKGNKAVAIIRPEHTKVLSSEEIMDNQFDVIVDNVAYFGPSLRLFCHTAKDNAPFFVDVFAETEMASTAIARSRITIGLDKEYALCYGIN